MSSTISLEKTRELQPGSSQKTLLNDYWELAKPEITLLVVIASLAGFLVGSSAGINITLLALTLAGTALCSAGGGVLNHYIERHHDARMRRTAQRPLPAGRISPRAALSYGVVLICLGLGLLAWVNRLTLLLAAFTIVLYLFAYTPLKRRTTLNTLVGTVPGALPALGGFTASTGTLGVGGWVLFAILAFWQMPHFLALAWMYRKDYARAGYQMLPVVQPDGSATTRQTCVYTLLLVGASVLPTLLDVTGWVYLTGALLTGAWFLIPTTAFLMTRTTKDARRVVRASIVYIPALVIAIAFDRWLL